MLYVIKLNIPPKYKDELLKLLRNDDYSGFVFETHTGFVMHYLPPSHRELFSFTEKIEKSFSSVQLEVIQNTEFFKVDMVPQRALDIFKERAKG